MSGIELLERLGDGSAAPAVILLGNADLATGVEAMKLGAVDAGCRSIATLPLPPPCARKLTATAASGSARANARVRRALVERLSAREREVLEHVVQGRLNKQIAARLNIAEQTVKQHRGRVMEKVGALRPS